MSVEYVVGRLNAGVEELGKASGPLEEGRAGAEKLGGEIKAACAALAGLIEFFGGLSDRYRSDVNVPYWTALNRYADGRNLIAEALRGADGSMFGSPARVGADTLHSKVGAALLNPDLIIGKLGGRASHIVLALEEAMTTAQRIAGGLEEMVDDTTAVQKEHPQTVQAVQQYITNIGGNAA